MSQPPDELSRPFTPQTFQQSVEQFHQLMTDITRRDIPASLEQRRQFITGEQSLPGSYKTRLVIQN